MEISVRSLWTILHGMGFGALYLLACSGAMVELWRFAISTHHDPTTPGHERFVRVYLVVMVVLAWVAVLTGTFLVYPWYRAVVPPGTVDLSGYPQRLLLAHAGTAGWHSLGMEWKEHVAWFTPVAITMVAFVFLKYGRDLKNHPYLRTTVLLFTMASFLAAGVAGLFGAMINKYAPVQGGTTIQFSHEENK